jgi:hypothetical protein
LLATERTELTENVIYVAAFFGNHLVSVNIAVECNGPCLAWMTEMPKQNAPPIDDRALCDLQFHFAPESFAICAETLDRGRVSAFNWLTF